MKTRREFLKFAAMVSGSAGISVLLPESIQRACAIEPIPGSTYRDAEHIVILMQENRSFDHTFGTLRGVRGFNDPRALRLANGNSVFVQTNKAGASYAPWRLDIKDTRITWMGSLPHSRDSQVDAWNEGRHDGWLDAKRSGDAEYADVPMTMGHYTREDLPFYYALADAFTVCDQYYCSVMSSTSPNRCSLWTGTIRDRQSPDSRVFIRNEEIDYGGLLWKTFPERLQEAGVSWKCYQNELTRSPLSDEKADWLSNFGDNTLECFAAYNVEAYPGFAEAVPGWITELSQEAEKLEVRIAAANDPSSAAHMRAGLKPIRDRIEALQAALPLSGAARYRKLSEQQKALFHAAFVTNAGDSDYHTLESLAFTDNGRQMTMNVPKGDLLYQFRKDVEEGQLPAISWLVAPNNFSDHPDAPWYGAWYVSEVMDILTKNPEVWRKTIFILNYDENDGYFDHAPSFVAADPQRPETGGASAGIDEGLEYTFRKDELAQGVDAHDARSGPIGMGFRVPMIVASPWSRGGWVNSQIFDHTSTLLFLEQFVQQRYGKTVREENISTWRRAISGDLTSVFRPHDATEPDFDLLNRNQYVVGIEKARYKEIPSNYHALSADQIAEINHHPFDTSLMPHQEPGIRPSCGLPYELYADGALSPDGTIFFVSTGAGNRIHGDKAAGAPFNIYLRNLKADSPTGPEIQAATWAVRAGDTLRQAYPLTLFRNGNFLIEVHGPNGFYRSFSGAAGAHQVRVRAEYERMKERPTGNLRVHLQNPGNRQMAVTITDESYNTESVMKTIPAGGERSVTLDLKKSHNWYDFTVRVDGSSFTVRFAGHVETGRSSMSDPFMGRAV